MPAFTKPRRSTTHVHSPSRVRVRFPPSRLAKNGTLRTHARSRLCRGYYHSLVFCGGRDFRPSRRWKSWMGVWIRLLCMYHLVQDLNELKGKAYLLLYTISREPLFQFPASLAQ